MNERVVVAGELMIDVLLVAGVPAPTPPPGTGVGEGLHVRGGGSAANVALALTASGHRVTVLGQVGPDANGRWLTEVLRTAGVDLRVGRDGSAPTGYVILHRRRGGDRVVYVERGANRHFSPRARLEPALADASWLHVSGFCLADPGPAEAARALVRLARDRGTPVSLDPGVTRAFPGREPEELLRIFTLGLASGPEVFLPSAALAVFLTGQPEPGAASAALGRRFRLAVVKDGCRGAWVDGQRLALNEGSAATEVDASGAGDVFDAAFISATLEGLSSRDAVAGANRAAAGFVTAGRGWVKVARQEPPVLVSACLAGVGSAYDGKPRGHPEPGRAGAGEERAGLTRTGWLADPPTERLLLPVCPEQLGGLGTPRPPGEILGEGGGPGVLAGRAVVATRDGLDVTEAVLKGARRTAELARATGAVLAVLREGSPSCGVDRIHDGRFGGGRIAGSGVATAVLRRLGVKAVASGHA